MPDPELYEILAAITTSLLEQKELNSVLDAINHHACSFFKASAASIMLFDEAKEYLTIARSFNLSPEYLKVVKVHKDQEVAGKVCQSKKCRFIKDVIELFKEIGDDFTVQWATKEGLVSLVCAPLLIKNQPIGCLNVYYRKLQDEFNQMHALDFFTRIAALSIEYSKLIQQSKEKTEILTIIEEVGIALTSSLNINEIMTIFLPIVILLTRADHTSLILVDDSKNKVIKAFEFTKGSDLPKKINEDIPLSDFISTEIMMTKRPAVIDDLREFKKTYAQGIIKDALSTAAIPLIARNKMLGILYVNSGSLRTFTKHEINYLIILCSQAAIAIDNTQLYEKTRSEAKEMTLLYEISQTFISTLNFDQLLKNILYRLKETFGYLNLAIMLVDEEKQELYPRSYINYPTHIKSLRFKIGKDGITGHVAATRQMYYSPDVSKDPYYRLGVEQAKSEICFPLMIGDQLIGVLDIESNQINGFKENDINMLSSLCAQIAIALDNSRLYEEARKLSQTDPLTVLPNRRSFEKFIDAEIKRSLRYHRPFSILMIDFDNFKNYNDTFGHPAGDKILKKYSQLMKDVIRDVDFLGRYGGDEFVVVLPETDSTFALEVAERMRRKIEIQKLEPHITLSIGIATFPTDSNEKESLMNIADQACYEAKQLGGNCVNFASKIKE